MEHADLGRPAKEASGKLLCVRFAGFLGRVPEARSVTEWTVRVWGRRGKDGLSRLRLGSRGGPLGDSNSKQAGSPA
jgi:hypothetical protein